MVIGDEDTTAWEQTPEEKARLERELNVHWAEEKANVPTQISCPLPPEDQEEEQRRRAEEMVRRIAAEKRLKAKKTKNTLLVIGAILVVVAMIVFARISSSTSTPPLTPAPTLFMQRYFMISLIQSRSASTSFADSSSPQSQSLSWILSDPFSSDGLSDNRLMQRFSLATLYYSMNGINWNHDGWLNSTNECDWGDSDREFHCSQESAVEQLQLGIDNLSGRIPIEIGLLNQLTYLSLHNNNYGNQLNQLTGSLPSELGLLNQLNELYLSRNQLTGPLPSELGLLIQLNKLRLSRSQLTGPLPSELGLLIQLTNLSLDNNQLTGFLPSELGILSQLNSLNLDVNQLTGSIPSEFGLLIQLDWLSLYNNTFKGSMPSSLCSSNATIVIDCGEIDCTCCRSASIDSCPS